MAKVLHDSTSQKILVSCFMNHARDQFLEDLMDMRIQSSAMVQLGGKSTDRTKPQMIREQASVKLDPTQWAQIDNPAGTKAAKARDKASGCIRAFSDRKCPEESSYGVSRVSARGPSILRHFHGPEK